MSSAIPNTAARPRGAGVSRAAGKIDSADSTRSLHSKMRETAQQVAECFVYFESARDMLGPSEKLALARAVYAALERYAALRATIRGGWMSTRAEDGLDSDLNLARELLSTPADGVSFDQVFATLRHSFTQEFKPAQA